MAKSKVRPGWVGPQYQAKDGKRPWVCDFVPWEPPHKKTRKNFGRDRNEARTKYADFVKAMKTPTCARKDKTFGDCLDEYLRWCDERRRLKLGGKLRMAASSLRKIRDDVKNHVRPALGHVPLGEVNSRMIQALIYKLAEEHKVVHNRVHTVIKCALLHVVEDEEWLDFSPLTRKRVNVPPVPDPETSIPEIEEGRAIWLATQERGHRERSYTVLNSAATVALAMFGGLEKGVVTALCWEHVDWVDGTISVEQSYSYEEQRITRDEGGDGIKDPKNKFRERVIPMADEVRQALTAIWLRDGRPASGWILKTAKGDPDNRLSIYTMIRTQYLDWALRKAGFEGRWGYHELRHYAGSVWLLNGMSLKDVSLLLGHSTVATTEKYYLHFFKKQQAERGREAMARVSAMHKLPAPEQKALRDLREIEVVDAEIVNKDN